MSTKIQRGAGRSSIVTKATAYASIETVEDDPAAYADRVPITARWAGTIAMEGSPTGDGRFIEPDALTWAVGEIDDQGRSRRIPLRDVEQDVGAHEGAVVVGNIDKIERREGGVIWAEGDFDLTSAAGLAAFRSVESGRKPGVSMDLDSVSFEIRVAQELIDEQEALLEAMFDEEGDLGKPEREVDEEGRVTVAGMNADDEMMVTTSARIRAATIVAIPAFDEATIEVMEVGYDEPSVDENSSKPVENDGERNDLTASGAPVAPPSSWFEQPRFNGPTAITVTDEGHIFGHIATWDVCHTASPAGPGICVTAPSSATGYARYHTGAVKTREGDVISTGRITMSTHHANPELSAQAAKDHYDHSGMAVADVRAYEDSYGIAVMGALRPGVTEEQIRELRGSSMSGDWRRVDGNLELHAVLTVNSPGFPVPRPQGLVASGNLQSLVASGIVVAPDREISREEHLSKSDLRYLQKLANRERIREAKSLESRVMAVKAKSARENVSRFAASRGLNVTSATITTSTKEK